MMNYNNDIQSALNKFVDAVNDLEAAGVTVEMASGEGESGFPFIMFSLRDVGWYDDGGLFHVRVADEQAAQRAAADGIVSIAPAGCRPGHK
jgi:hypothetical protein